MVKNAKEVLNDILYTLGNAIESHNDRDLIEYERQMSKVRTLWDLFSDIDYKERNPYEAVQYAKIVG